MLNFDLHDGLKSINYFEPLALQNKGKGQPLRTEAKSDKCTDMHVSGVIVNADPFESGAIVGDEFVKALNDITTPEINLYLNSPGGSVFAGVQMASAMNQHPSTINVYVTGIAASAATYLLLAADKTYISKMGQVMIHKTSCLAYGNADELQNVREVLQKNDETMAVNYAEKTGLDQSKVAQMMAKTTYFNAQEAVDNGFIDEVVQWKPKNSIDWVLETKNTDTHSVYNETEVTEPEQPVQSTETEQPVTEDAENAETDTETQVDEPEITNSLDIELLKRLIDLEIEMANL